MIQMRLKQRLGNLFLLYRVFGPEDDGTAMSEPAPLHDAFDHVELSYEYSHVIEFDQSTVGDHSTTVEDEAGILMTGC